MGHEDPSAWLTSRGVLDALTGRRNNDVKVNIDNILVPTASIAYHPQADSFVIELVDGVDKRIALHTDPPPDVSPVLSRDRLSWMVHQIAIMHGPHPGPDCEHCGLTWPCPTATFIANRGS